MKVLLAHPGTQYSFHLARQLHKHNVLYKFYTGIAFGDGGLFTRLILLLPKKLLQKITDTLLQTKGHVPDTLLEKHVNNENRENFIKSAIVNLMSTPEYQLC